MNIKKKTAIIKNDIPDGLWYSNMRGRHITVEQRSKNPKEKYKIEGTTLYIRKVHLDILGNAD